MQAAHLRDGSWPTQLRVSTTSPLNPPIADIGADIIFPPLRASSGHGRIARDVEEGPTATRRRCSNDAYSITSAARSRIEVGMVMPSDLGASHFTTTVVPTDTRL